MKELVERIEIVGGHSSHGSITIQSDRFTSNVQVDGSGVVHRTVQPTPPAARLVAMARHPLVPRVAKISAFIVAEFSRKELALFAGLIIFVNGLGYLLPHFNRTRSLAETIGFNLLFWAVVGWRVRLLISPWHAAEHMAIATYRRLGSVRLSDMRQASRVDPSCGGRLFAPILLASYLGTAIERQFGLNYWAGYLLLVEGFLRLDEAVGLDRVPVFGHLSRLLQQYVTTQEPEDHHLEVARHALLGLLIAHNEERMAGADRPEQWDSAKTTHT